ncbi:hypothetical protein GCM10010448_52210 [Streptomyces glomeratus]|uniref:Uncharacterized protein n=1 Tax=Streptomyces glomeratus TaxID=284452 RepID=A0ABP6LZG8_9ACTN
MAVSLRSRWKTRQPPCCPGTAGGLRAVINAIGLVLHTNLGRADGLPSWTCAQAYAPAEGARLCGTLHDRAPSAAAVHVVDNGAAALVLLATAPAAGKDIVVSRGRWWWRSGTVSGSRTSYPPGPGSASSAPPTARPSPTTPPRSARTPAWC